MKRIAFLFALTALLDLRSSKLTLGKADASIALLLLTCSLICSCGTNATKSKISAEMAL